MQSAHEESGATHLAQRAEPARSFYLLEESMCVIAETGHFRPYATTEELRARLEPKLSHHESLGRPLNYLLLGESVNVWTVQRGQLVAGLDVAEFVSVHLPTGVTTVSEHVWHGHDFSSGKRTDPPPSDEGAPLTLDWDGIIAQLPPLEAPLAVPGDKNLAVLLDGPHPAPDILSYIDDLISALAHETPHPEWKPDGLDYGSPFSV